MAKAKVVKKVTDFNVEILDNGFTLRYSGEDADDNWADTKMIVADVDTLTARIKEIAALPRE